MTHDAAPSPREASRSRADLSLWSERHIEHAGADPVVVDCDTCCARGIGCGDCVVTVLLGGPPSGVTLNDEERRAVDVLAAAGLIPPLRLAYDVSSPFVEPP